MSDCCDRPVGSNTCHCAGCHFTFSAISPFDRHQRLDEEAGRTVCLDPRYARGRNGKKIFMEVRSGVWGRNAPRPEYLQRNFP